MVFLLRTPSERSNYLTRKTYTRFLLKLSPRCGFALNGHRDDLLVIHEELERKKSTHQSSVVSPNASTAAAEEGRAEEVEIACCSSDLLHSAAPRSLGSISTLRRLANGTLGAFCSSAARFNISLASAKKEGQSGGKEERKCLQKFENLMLTLCLDGLKKGSRLSGDRLRSSRLSSSLFLLCFVSRLLPRLWAGSSSTGCW